MNKETKKEVVEVPVKKRSGSGVQVLKGMKDILPSEQPYWNLLRNKLNQITDAYRFQRIDPPILEATSLFKRSVGEITDIVEKEMFSFIDQGGDKISLRPEITASICRAYIEHGMFNLPQPVKMFYVGPVFRHEKPQSGRYRQFYQIGFEVLGEDKPAADVQVMVMTYNFLKDLGLKTIIHLNTIGCKNCLPEYKKELLAYYKNKKKVLCESCLRRIGRSPLRLLDCKDEKCQLYKREAPQVVDFVCDDCRNHFMKVLEYLDDLDIPYVMNSFLVRGLDYYNRTVFEFFEEGTEVENVNQANAIGAGGRYDYLVEMLGGREASAVGIALGMERIILALKAKEIQPPEEQKFDVFLAQIGEQAKRRAFVLFEKCRNSGINMAENIAKDSLKAQLELADKLGVKFVLILGQKEIIDNTIIIRDMEGSLQETVREDKIVEELKKRLIDKK